MQSASLNLRRISRFRGFSLIELLTVIAIISILMTVAAIGVGGAMGGKGVGSAVASVEAVFEEARSTAISRQTKTRVLVDVSDPKSRENYLRRVVMVYEELDENGAPIKDNWVLGGRAFYLPDHTFFSRTFSVKDISSGSGQLDSMTLTNVSRAYQGEYLYYEFNSEGISSNPGASFIVGTGARNIGEQKPIVTASSKRDFGGFVVRRNGRTSVFRSPEQMNLPSDFKNF